MFKKREDNGLTQHATALAVPIGVSLAIWAVICFFVPRDAKVSVALASLTILLHWVLIFYLGWILISRPRTGYLEAPIVRQVRDDGQVLMVGNAPWLGLRVQVSVFVMDGDFERQISLGYVRNVQGNQLVQIYLPREDGSENPFQSIEMDKIIIKPGLLPEVL